MRSWSSLRALAGAALAAAVVIGAVAVSAPTSGASASDHHTAVEAPEPARAPEAPLIRVMQCESGVDVAPDGTESSSATVERVPTDTPLAPGCHWLD